MKKLYTLLIALFIVGGAMGQTDGPCETCLPEGITFTTQAQIDSFQINYPNCTKIGGYVIINESNFGNISNLNSLSVINAIDGDLQIFHNYMLNSLYGLHNLDSIGGNLVIGKKDQLGTCLSNSIADLNDLGNLSHIGGSLMIAHNAYLSDLSGLENIEQIGGGLGIIGNCGLVALSGLSNLTEIGGGIDIGGVPSSVNPNPGNHRLDNLDGLSSLSTINGNISICYNDSLTNVSGLANILSETIEDIHILNNPNLSTCHCLSICDYLVSPNGEVSIVDNSIGCNSLEEVKDSCEAHAGIDDGLSLANGLVIYPNPAHSTITIELQTQPSHNTSLTLSNTNGQQIITQPITRPQTEIDISHLPVGIYIVKVWNDKDVMVRKVIKQ